MEIDEDLLSCYFCGGVKPSAVWSPRMFCSEVCERAAAEIAQLEARVSELMLELERVRQ